MKPFTKFDGKVNPFTGKELLHFVPIPDRQEKCKGTTKYDEKFEVLLDFKQALNMPLNEYGAVRKALQRFRINKGIEKTTSMRQQKGKTAYLIWLVNKSPNGVNK